jgi:hypothetical protein
MLEKIIFEYHGIYVKIFDVIILIAILIVAATLLSEIFRKTK